MQDKQAAHLAIIFGLSPTGLYAARELSAAGIKVLGISDSFEAGRYSAALTHPDKFWVLDDPAEMVERLVALGSSCEHPPVLMPTNDRLIAFISDHADALRPHFLFQDSYRPDFYLKLVDKQLFYDACEKHHIAYPKLLAADRDGLADLAEDIRFPVILKPSLIHEVRDFMAGRKVLIAETLDAYRSAIASIPSSNSEWLVQEIIPGPESNIRLFGGYFDRESRLHQGFTCVKVRQFPPGFGSASLAYSRPEEEIFQISRDFLQALSFQGIAGTEFKWDDRDKLWKIIEINPRPTLWFHISHSSDKRIALAAYRDLCKQSLPEERPQQNGVLWRYAVKDLYSQVFYRKNKEFIFDPPDVRGMLRDGVKKKSWPVFAPGDLRPMFMENMQYIRKIFARLGR